MYQVVATTVNPYLVTSLVLMNTILLGLSIRAPVSNTPTTTLVVEAGSAYSGYVTATKASLLASSPLLNDPREFR